MKCYARAQAWKVAEVWGGPGVEGRQQAQGSAGSVCPLGWSTGSVWGARCLGCQAVASEPCGVEGGRARELLHTVPGRGWGLLVSQRRPPLRHPGAAPQVVPHITDAIQDWIQRVAHVPVSARARLPAPRLLRLGCRRGGGAAAAAGLRAETVRRRRMRTLA